MEPCVTILRVAVEGAEGVDLLGERAPDWRALPIYQLFMTDTDRGTQCGYIKTNANHRDLYLISKSQFTVVDAIDDQIT